MTVYLLTYLLMNIRRLSRRACAWFSEMFVDRWRKVFVVSRQLSVCNFAFLSYLIRSHHRYVK